MKTKLFVFFLILGLVSIASAQPGRDVTWTLMAAPPTPFFGAGSGILGNYFYCFGADNSLVHTAQAFNLTTELWEASTLPPLGLEFNSATTDSAIYLITWSDSSYHVGPDVQKFTPFNSGPTGEWTPMAPYPVAVCDLASAWDGDNYIYGAGGWRGGQSYSNAYRYDIAANTWTPIANMPYSNDGCGGAFVNGRFYVVGGVYNMGQQLCEYNPGNNSWTIKTSPPIGVPAATYCTTFNDSLVFTVGGGGNITYASDEVQVYDPRIDLWTQETPLPLALGYNCARFVPPNEIICAGGWGPGAPFTYLGTGFPSSGIGLINITMTPINPPIIIPASGGSFSYNATLENQGTAPDSFDVWIMVQLPSGSWWGPALGPVSLTLPASGSITRLRTQIVPANAPSGDYWYEGRVGDYPDSITSNSGFIFTKLTTGDGPWVSDWSCTGEEISVTDKPLSTQHSALITSVNPNPFNPTTVLSYQLPVASHVNLRIYDTAGRSVTELINGWRGAGEHQITFDPKGAGGSGLPSGIYLARLTAGNYSQVRKMVLLK